MLTKPLFPFRQAQATGGLLHKKPLTGFFRISILTERRQDENTSKSAVT